MNREHLAVPATPLPSHVSLVTREHIEANLRGLMLRPALEAVKAGARWCGAALPARKAERHGAAAATWSGPVWHGPCLGL